MKRKIIIAASVVVAFLALVTTRVVCSSSEEYWKGERALQSIKIDLAIIHYRRAARWYAPLNPYVGRSLDRLWELGQQAEARGDVLRALKCYRSIRGAILGARSFYTPHSERLGPVNRRIARLMAAQQVELEAKRTHEAPRAGPTPGAKAPASDSGPGTSSSADHAKRRAKLERWHLKQLKKTTAPSVGWSVLAVLGFVIWVTSAFVFAYRAISSDDRLLKKPALIWGGAIVLGLALWMMGLSLA